MAQKYFFKRTSFNYFSRRKQNMGKTILISALLMISAFSMNSFKKCYVCTQTIQETVNNVTDSTINLRTELCSGKNGAGPKANLTAAVNDIEANGYICVEQ